ncbi:MAG: MDR family MFS transporter [Gaiellaceae bacterium]
MSALRARLARKPPGYRYTIGRILAIYAGLMATLLLAALDQTIIATALPRIVSDLGGLTSYTWVITAYLLAATVTVPLYGKLGDVYGRRRMFLASIVIFLAGSVLCGLAQTMIQLVVFRGIQGIGAGGIFPLALATIATTVPPRDRGRYQGLIGATFAGASILGPTLGGFIVDNMSWRWIFYVNLPVGGLALVVIWLTMPREAPTRQRSVDYLGAAVLGAGTAALLLGLVWGGREYAWLSWQVLAAFTASVALLALFAAVELRVTETILPFDLLRRRTVAAGTAAITLVGMAMLGTIAFVPLFVQGVIGTSATASGVVLTPFMLAAVTASVLSGQWISRTGRYKPNALLGPVVLGGALFALSRLDETATRGDAAICAVVAGIGLGLMMQTFVLAVQNAVPVAEMGSATALVQFARSIGGTLGITIMGVIVSQGLPPGTGARTPSIERLPPALRAELADAMQPAFLASAGICALALLVVIFVMREVPLRRDFEDATFEALPETAFRSDSAPLTSGTR